MSIDRQWGRLEVIGLLKEEQPEEAKEVKIASAPTASPKPPPPKAPFGVRAFAADPPSSSRDYLGGADSKWKDSKWAEGGWKDPKGTDAKGKGRKGESESDNEEETGKAAGAHYNSYSEREKNWAPTNRSGERAYREYRDSPNEWMWMDGEWRDARDPTEEVDAIDGDTQK